MELNRLLHYDDIVIQCHNNPDADAIASGYGIFLYLKTRWEEAGLTQKRVRLIYGGPYVVKKSNLKLMIEKLTIPIQHVVALEEEPELLLAVDCQHGERNLQPFPAKALAAIDHHKLKARTIRDIPKELRDIRDNYGSCASIVYDLLRREDFPVAKDERLSTALYYGLFMDTIMLQELRHPKDKDLRNDLEFQCDNALLFEFQHRNLSLEEMEIAGRALTNCDYHASYRFAIVAAEPCDPNILGIISDMLIEVEDIDCCVVYCMRHDNGKAKLSVRSCVREIRADELARSLADGFGGGGGHLRKAGGTLEMSLVAQAYEERFGRPLPAEEASHGVHQLLDTRLEGYFQNQDSYHPESGQAPDLSGEPLYEKLCKPIGYVRGTDLYPVGSRVQIRMLEGDDEITIQEDTYFIIGVGSEVYTNTKAYLLAHNELTDAPYHCQAEYPPTVRQTIPSLKEAVSAVGQESKSLEDYAKVCIPKKGSYIRGRQIVRRTKVFRSWLRNNYMLGNPGDWLVAREEDHTNVYIIQKDIFEKSYTLVHA